MRVRWSRGLRRLWLVASFIWVAFSVVFYGTAYSALPPKVKPSLGYFDDLIPKYKPSWDYWTDDGKNIDISKLSDDALVRIYECQLKVDQSSLLMSAAATVIGGPSWHLFLDGCCCGLRGDLAKALRADSELG
jgi:hypothetical protein